MTRAATWHIYLIEDINKSRVMSPFAKLLWPMFGSTTTFSSGWLQVWTDHELQLLKKFIKFIII